MGKATDKVQIAPARKEECGSICVISKKRRFSN